MAILFTGCLATVCSFWCRSSGQLLRLAVNKGGTQALYTFFCCYNLQLFIYCFYTFRELTHQLIANNSETALLYY